MKTKKCEHCKGDIIGKREDAKFCSNTCKAKHWEEKKLLKKQEKNLSGQLRGILSGTEDKNNTSEITNLQPAYKTVEIRVPNLARFPFEMQHKRLKDVRKQLERDIQLLQNKLKQIASDNGNQWLMGLTGAGAFIGNKTAEKKNQGALLGAAVGLLTGMIARGVTHEDREQDKKKQAENIQKDIKEKTALMQDFNKGLKILEEKLQATPLFLISKKQVSISEQKTIEASTPAPGTLTGNELLKPLKEFHTDVFDVSFTDINSDKIISSQNLKKMEFKALNFQGKWQNLFGYPSVHFHCVLHGMSGEGKSTFSIQFAKYLADNFGWVIYISGEEGFSKTFKDKFLNNNAESKYLDIADLRTYDDIIREVPPEFYNFIFIDSLDNMKIDVDKMKKIRKRYKNSALITISQSTKEGKMRGSYEIVHDCDIAVKVENGVATTTKNRFKEKGMSFEVFENKKAENTTPSIKDSFWL